MMTLRDYLLTLIIALGIILVTGWMSQRDEVDCPSPRCEARPGETAVNAKGRCEIHATYDFLQAQFPSLACPIAGGCYDGKLVPVGTKEKRKRK